MTLIGTDTITGTDVEIHAHDDGEWFIREMNTEHDGTGRGPLGRGTTLEAAKNAARATLRKRRVEVAVKFKDADGNECVAYSIHAGNGDVLARVNGGTAAERFGYSAKAFDVETTPEEFAGYHAAHDRQRKAAAEIRAFEELHKVNLKALVNGAMIDAAAEGATA